MKLKSTITVSYEEVCALFDIVKEACLAQYVTLEDQTAAINAARIEFEKLLNEYIAESFKIGKKHQKAKMLAKYDDTTSPAQY